VKRGLYPAEGPVVAEPVVVGERVVLGSTHGEVIAYPLGGGGAAWTVRTEGGIDFPLRAIQDKGLVLVAADDARLYAITASTGQIAWTFEAEAPIDGPPLVLPGGVGLPLQTGKIVVVDAATGNALPLSWADPEKRRIAVAQDAEGKRLVVATVDGIVKALDPTTLQPVWKADFVRKTTARPRLAFFGTRVIIAGDGPTPTEPERPHVWGVDSVTGRLVWQGRFPERAGRVIAISASADVLLLSTTKNYLHAFDKEDHGP
jgi:outer membrane protein assembly factor BamB